MNTQRQRQLLLALITAVTLGSTILVATANGLAPGPQEWVGSWAAAPAAPDPCPNSVCGIPSIANTGFANQTIRMMIHTSVGGSQARLRLSNRYGKKPLTFGHVTVGQPWTDSGPGDLRPGSIKEVTFNGQQAVTVPPGGAVASDPIMMEVGDSQDLSVSIYLPKATGPATWHWIAKSTTYFGPDDHAGDPSGAALAAKSERSWFFLTGLDVLNRNDAGAIVVLGDSIGDGYGTTSNANKRWPDLLAARLNREMGDDAPGVLNASLSGNRLGHDGSELGLPPVGPSASARFGNDVLAQAGVHTVVIELGINDIWMSQDSPDAIISHLKQLSALARQAGLRVVVCTLMPWNEYKAPSGVVAYSPALETTRQQVNSFIRTSIGEFDAVIDFDLVLRDRADSTRLRADFERPGAAADHIHPNDSGNEAMANAVPLGTLLPD